MELRFLGAHNAESRQSRLASLLIDNVLALDAGGLTSSLSFRAQQKLKAVLITHQHYDHIRDIPALAMNFFVRQATIKVYSTRPVRKALATYFFDGNLYPNFLEPRDGRLTIDFSVVEPHREMRVEGYVVKAIPVSHGVPAVGYQITSSEGDSLFYTGDTGPGLFESWRHMSPHLMVVDVTMPSRFEEAARQSGHLTPSLLKAELTTFRSIKGYLPSVIAVHMTPDFEPEIADELASVAEEMDADISTAHEGLTLRLQNR